MIDHSNYQQPLLNGGVARRQIAAHGFLVSILLMSSLLAIFKLSTIEKAYSSKDWVKAIMEIPDANLSKLQMHRITERQSLAGSAGDFQLATYVAEQFREFGVPQVEILEYKVLLSTPLSSSLSMIRDDGTQYQFNLEEPEIRPESDVDPTSVNPYIAYSGSKNVTAPTIYVNYGRKADFEFLVRSGINLTNHIGIARYGEIFRGIKVMLAEQYGMIGLIIYSDPADDGDRKGKVYPDGEWRPPKSIQGGSSMFISLFSGDPLTPGVAALPDLDPVLRKYNPENSPVLPKIPVLAIGYGNAKRILKLMGGRKAPNEWQGGLPIEYNLGPGPILKMNVEMDRSLRSIYNVIGTFQGSSQPDREILMGNHRDAWVYGAVDPHSGTVALLESARAFSQIYKDGWRPKRTLKICSWDAEEFGLVGSSEFAEQFAQVLQDEAVVYLNIDVAVSGDDLIHITASPSMSDIFQNATKLVQLPNSTKSIYDLWAENSNCTIEPIGSGSDYSAFIQNLGIPSADLGFSGEDGQYGVYHSKYDDISWYEKFADPDYGMSTTITMLWLVLAISFVDSAILPFRITPYAAALQSYVKSAQQDTDDAECLESIAEAVSILMKSAKTIDARADLLTANEDLEAAAALNDKLAFMERSFLMNDMLPGRPELYYRHSIFAPDLYSGYGASVIPGLKYALDSGNATLIQHQADILRHCILNASFFLTGGP